MENLWIADSTIWIVESTDFDVYLAVKTKEEAINMAKHLLKDLGDIKIEKAERSQFVNQYCVYGGKSIAELKIVAVFEVELYDNFNNRKKSKFST